jgi:hypothetical protein
VRQIPALLHQFGICDHQYFSSEGTKYESLGATTPHSPTDGSLVAAIWTVECHEHPPYGSDFAQNGFPVFGHLRKHLGYHRIQNAGEVQEAVSQWFRCQHPEFRAEGVRSLITRNKCMNLQGDCVEKYAIVVFSREKCYFEERVDE